jgi:hypothetical protein
MKIFQSVAIFAFLIEMAILFFFALDRPGVGHEPRFRESLQAPRRRESVMALGR